MRPNSFVRRCALALGCSVMAVGLVWAGPAWRELTNIQQALIKPALLSQGGDFDKLPESRRAALIKGADRWLAMSPAQRTTATQQFQQWQQLSAGDKVAVLEMRERFRKLSPDQRKALLDTQKQFRALPLQQQKDLREEFNELRPLPQLDELPMQPSLGTPGTTAPGSSSPFGLPGTTLPSNGTVLPAFIPR